MCFSPCCHILESPVEGDSLENTCDWPHTSLKSKSLGMIRYFIECLSIGICLLFMLWLDWSYCFYEEDHRIKGTHYQEDC